MVVVVEIGSFISNQDQRPSVESFPTVLLRLKRMVVGEQEKIQSHLIRPLSDTGDIPGAVRIVGMKMNRTYNFVYIIQIFLQLEF
jgi:hypothetical protein